MPKVSIILTSFNHSKFIRESIESVLNQTFKDFELIIWDDASSDLSWYLINQYTDSRIKSYRNEVNKGPVYGVNKAISEIATGEYIAIHHSDDVWELNKLETQVAFLDTHLDIGAVFSDAQAINEDSLPLLESSHYYADIFQQKNKTRHQWLHFFFIKDNALCHPSVLIRKRCYQDCGLYRPMLAQVPDFDMWIRLCLKYEIHVLPEKLVRFRVLNQEANTSGNRSDTRIRRLYECYKVLPNYQKISSIDELILIFPEAKKYYKSEQSNVTFALAMIALENRHFPFSILFGLELLSALLSDKEQALKIEQVYNFNYLDFINLTAHYDVFSQEQINTIHQNLIDVIQEVRLIENSISWRITKPLRKLFGQNSFLGKSIRCIMKFLWRITTKLKVLPKWRSWQLLKDKETDKFHISPPNNSFLSVPFSYSLQPFDKPNVAVVCHLYYPELLTEFKSYLVNIPFAFDLFITTDTVEKKQRIEGELKNWQKGLVEIRITENRGRDIAPKLVTYHDVYQRYEFFLHIHSKKSPHAQDVTAGWRKYLLDTLLGSEQVVNSIFSAFMADKKLGIIASEHFDPIREYVGWGCNFTAAEQFALQMNMKLHFKGNIDFPSGSMFWGRSAAIKPLLDMNLTTEDFPPEEKQIDATLAHVIERLYFFICEQAGYRWIKIANPLKLKNIDRLLIVENQAELVDIIKSIQYPLLVKD